jgi:hypothetical protein
MVAGAQLTGLAAHGEAGRRRGDEAEDKAGGARGPELAARGGRSRRREWGRRRQPGLVRAVDLAGAGSSEREPVLDVVLMKVSVGTFFSTRKVVAGQFPRWPGHVHGSDLIASGHV